MSAANRKTGKDFLAQWINANGTYTISGDMRNFDFTGEQETADVTAMGDGARVFKGTVQNFGATGEILFTGTAGSAVFAQLTLGGEGTLLYGPEGTAAGKPKGGFPAICTKADEAYAFDDAVVITVEFQGQGARLFDPKKDVW